MGTTTSSIFQALAALLVIKPRQNQNETFDLQRVHKHTAYTLKVKAVCGWVDVVIYCLYLGFTTTTGKKYHPWYSKASHLEFVFIFFSPRETLLGSKRQAINYKKKIVLG